MRLPIFLLALLALAPAAAPAANVQMVRVWPEWKDAESFKGIWESITGKEATGGWIIIRSHPEARGGFYFLTRLKNREAPEPGARFVLTMILPDSPDPKVYTFPASIPKGSHLFELGLTGSDWAGQKLHPVAWKLELHNAAGQILAAKTSFLWEKPLK